MIEKGTRVSIIYGWAGRPFAGNTLEGIYQGYTDIYLCILDPATQLEALIPWDKILRICEMETVKKA